MVQHFNIAKKLKKKFLQGRPLGRKHFPELCALLTQIPEGETILLDFNEIEIVTGSWINEALVPLLDWMTDQRNDLFLVIVNFNSKWHDELQMVAEWTHKCFLVAKGKKLPSSAKLIGRLDVGQRQTLEAVLQVSEATGAGLERHKPDTGVKATAWNNRLKDLNRKRLLRREKRGREQVYSPVISEVTIDG